MKHTFEILVGTSQGIFTYWVDTDFNLLEQYKTALILGSGAITWEEGALDRNQVVGIFDRTLKETRDEEEPQQGYKTL